MNKLTKISALVCGLLLAGVASAANMYINIPGYDYSGIGGHTADADSQTGLFNEFGYSQLMATSVYDLSDGSVFGSFYDTNMASELASLNIPASGVSMAGPSQPNVSLTVPVAAQVDLDALSPLAPPLSSDNEGFLATWALNILYHFDGTLGAGGPVYTGGTFSVFFNDFTNDANDREVMSGILTGSLLQAANLNLFLTLTSVEANFLFVDDGFGNFYDASTRNVPLVLDTNVNPPIPTPNQLLVVVDDNGNPNAIRQTTLDGSIGVAIPEPASLALIGLGLLGLSVTRRRQAK